MLIHPEKKVPSQRQEVHQRQKHIHELNGNAHIAFTMEEQHLGALPFKH